MKIIGFNFTKITAEKISHLIKEITVNSSIDILDVSEAKADFFNADESLLGLKFSFGLHYEPNLAKIIFEGTIILSVDKDTSKEVLEQWKDKKTPDSFNISVLNTILKKSTLRALQLEEELGLPLHIQLPSLKKEGK
jgi:hypothetical protein